jgi:NDP-sugar pyrophosphorylase family protein
MIKAYFNDTDKDYNIHFWDEDRPLGTGGGLYLLKDCISSTFILTNCDILILEDVRNMVQHHKEENNKATMVCSLKNFEIPYGIVNFAEGGEISSFEEKPQLSFFTNTGYYILEPDIFNYIDQDEKIGMPDIIDRMRRDGMKVGIYPISENAWLDMGQFDSMESMEQKLKGLDWF